MHNTYRGKTAYYRVLIEVSIGADGFLYVLRFFCTSKTDKSIGNSFRLAGGQEWKTIYGTILFVADLKLTNYPFFVFYFPPCTWYLLFFLQT